MVGMMTVGLLFPGISQALEDRPDWQKLDKALMYLRGVPEVAWVKFHENNVYISWKGQPENFARINQVAAKKAAQALHNEVTVYSLPPGEELPADMWGYEPSPLCRTIANPHEIVDSNCH